MFLAVPALVAVACGTGQAKDAAKGFVGRTAAASCEPTPTEVPPRDGFIRNEGQLDSSVAYYAPGVRGAVFLTREAAVFDLIETPPGRSAVWSDEQGGGTGAVGGKDRPRVVADPDVTARAWAVYVRFKDASRSAEVEARSCLSQRYNFFLGNDPGGWRSGVHAYREVVYKGLWPDVDLVFRLREGGLESAFVVQEGAEPPTEPFSYEGAEKVVRGDDGTVRLLTPAAELTLNETSGGPVRLVHLAQARKSTDGNGGAGVAESEGALSLRMGYSTFLGGSGFDDRGLAIALDPAGNPIVTGWTWGLDFPVTPGAYDVSWEGHEEIFVTKLTPDVGNVVSSTLLGGGGGDIALDLAVADGGEPVVVGYTASSDFPTTPGAFDPTYNGSLGAFVAKLSADASELLFSTFLGQMSLAEGVALDGAGNVVVVGEAGPPGFPTTPGAYDESHNGDYDVFVTKLAADGSSLDFSTFLGGDGFEAGREVALDQNGDVVVAGDALWWTFPTTPDAFDPSHNGRQDVFVSKLSADGASLLYSTFLGSSEGDDAHGLAVDEGGNAVVTGVTGGYDFPTTPGAYDTQPSGTDTFIAKLTADGRDLVYSTFFGGRCAEWGYAMDLDVRGNVVFAGATCSGGDFPVTVGTYDASYNGGLYDVFVSELSSDGGTLLYSTYLGGKADEWANGLVLDVDGSPIVMGTTLSVDFPTTPDSYDPSYNGGTYFGDVFVTKLRASPLILTGPTPGQAGTLNRVDVSGARPGATVHVVYGFKYARTEVPNCADASGDIRDPVVFGKGVADAAGTASVEGAVPADFSGRNVLIQAVEPASCTVSNLIEYRFP